MTGTPRGPGRPDPGAAGLLAAKEAAGLSLSVCLPAHDEESTVGEIVGRLRRDLIDAVPLVDELLVVDDGSTDATARVAARAGAVVVTEAAILPEEGPGSGKGNALWKSLYASSGDLVCWLDADVRNFRSDFVTRLVAPLLAEPDVVLTKAFYRRPLHGEPEGGGRVTELMARPLLSHLFPKLAEIVQPLSGEYAGRRDALETLPFVEGWGVELGLLVDVVEAYGTASVVQVDLGSREHRNRPLRDLGPQALAILVTALRRAGLDPTDGATELVRFDDDARLEVVAVEVRERPPLRTVGAYRRRFGRDHDGPPRGDR